MTVGSRVLTLSFSLRTKWFLEQDVLLPRVDAETSCRSVLSDPGAGRLLACVGWQCSGSDPRECAMKYSLPLDATYSTQILRYLTQVRGAGGDSGPIRMTLLSRFGGKRDEEDAVEKRPVHRSRAGPLGLRAAPGSLQTLQGPSLRLGTVAATPSPAGPLNRAQGSPGLRVLETGRPSGPGSE